MKIYIHLTQPFLLFLYPTTHQSLCPFEANPTISHGFSSRISQFQSGSFSDNTTLLHSTTIFCCFFTI
ncbi:hypothetical protein L1887_34796 [Cichorium endivia]|nr:hypothetical protein L1887_34796 [Cichorium endivia]